MGGARHFQLAAVFVVILAQYSMLQEPSPLGAYPHGAVTSDVGRCSSMGSAILRQGGSAMDAAITSVLCIGVVNPQSSGIGGGFSMVVYTNNTKTAVSLMATEAAPIQASPDMFTSRSDSQQGVKTIAVPGEVLGLWEAHRLFGKLPWEELFRPVIEMAETGFQVTSHLPFVIGSGISLEKYPIFRNIGRKIYYRNGKPFMRTGDTMSAPVLASTLRKIAMYGPNVFYTGSVADDLISDIKEAGGILTPADFATYSVLWKQVTSTTFKNNITMFSAPLTSSGPVLQYIMNVLDEYNITRDDFDNFDDRLRLYHRFLEVGKFAFGIRNHLGDDPTSTTVRKILSDLESKEFAKFTASLINDTHVTFSSRYDYDISRSPIRDHAAEEDKSGMLGDTGHVSVVAENGDAVSITTSVGYYFGSKFYSRRTGIWLNNHLANFFFPNREANPIWRWPTANGIAPRRRYLTTVCPSILTDDEGNARLVVGASGGSRIVATNAWVILRTLWMGSSLQDAVDERRIYNYLPQSNSAYYEQGFPSDLQEELATMGHLTKSSRSFAVSQSILRSLAGGWDAYSDPRKGGMADGY